MQITKIFENLVVISFFLVFFSKPIIFDSFNISDNEDIAEIPFSY